MDMDIFMKGWDVFAMGALGVGLEPTLAES